MRDYNDLVINTIVEKLLNTIKDNNLNKEEIIEYLNYLYEGTK